MRATTITTNSRRRRTLLLFLTLLLGMSAIAWSLSALVGWPSLGRTQAGDQPEAPTGLTKVIRYGDGERSRAVTDRLGDRGVPVSVEMTAELDIDPSSPQTAVFFDGSWLAARHDSEEVYEILRKAGLAGAPLLVVGGDTSLFIDALQAAGVYGLGLRNPASSNPPMVGFVFRVPETRSGPARLFSNTTDADRLLAAFKRFYENDYAEDAFNE